MRINEVSLVCQMVKMVMLLGILAGEPFVAGIDSKKSPGQISAVVDVAQPQSEGSRELDYRVRRFFFPADKKRFSIILVTANPKHFNREDMTALAAQLNKEFAGEIRLKAAVFDDDNIPRLFVTGGLELPEYEEARRGLYYLDRSKCREHIQFSTRSGRPKNEVTIKFNCLRPMRPPPTPTPPRLPRQFHRL